MCSNGQLQKTNTDLNIMIAWCLDQDFLFYTDDRMLSGRKKINEMRLFVTRDFHATKRILLRTCCQEGNHQPGKNY